jgi:3-hydroxyisobutyrate dehydrogenase-like beta-hydroxyacid dehydrogenase
MPTVGLIGLGLLGSAIAERLISRGFDVCGFDLLPDRREVLRSLGGKPAEEPQQVFDRCDRVVLSLPTSTVVQSVLESVRPTRGTLILDTTTGDPDDMRALGESLRQKGVNYCDATVAGSSAEARAGEVVVMVGGDPSAVEGSYDILSGFARRVCHVGSCGSGARMKLVVNLVLGLNRLVLAEGLAFADALGLDGEAALDVLKDGPAFSQVIHTKGQKMLQGEYAPVARLSQHFKDVRLILEQGRKHAIDLPVSTLHERLLADLEARGFGNEDNSAIRRAF